MISVNQANKRILKNLKQISHEMIPLNQACGRVTESSIYAKLNKPSFNSSAMDGYAIRAKDTTTAPKLFKVIDEVAAGHPSSKSISLNEAVRIYTGGRMVPGSDSVIIQEEIKIKNKDIIINKKIKKGEYVRKKGIDFNKGDILLRKGHIISSRDLGVLASSNYSWIKVKRKPLIGIISTGDEVINVGEKATKSSTYSSNSILISSLIKETGAIPLDLGIAKDTTSSLKQIIKNSNQLDFLITLGGISVGNKDLVRKTLISMGFKLSFWKIAMKPGKPAMFGYLSNLPILCLPGNPVSATICSIVFVRPAIYKLLGINKFKHQIIKAKLENHLNENHIRENYLRGIYSHDKKGSIKVKTINDQDSSLVYNLSMANCLIKRKAYAKKEFIGNTVEIILFPNSLNTV